MSASLQLTPGLVFAGDFKIIAPLAEGGMGSVYVVEQLSTGNPRALKVMQPALFSDERLRQRFAQEARIGALIESDHVVQVVAAGVDVPSGTPWLAMELLKGRDPRRRDRAPRRALRAIRSTRSSRSSFTRSAPPTPPASCIVT